jgi:hypothetical protein
MVVWQGVAMDSPMFYPGPPCNTLLRPAALFYPFGHPTPYAYRYNCLKTEAQKHLSIKIHDCKQRSVSTSICYKPNSDDKNQVDVSVTFDHTTDGIYSIYVFIYASRHPKSPFHIAAVKEIPSRRRSSSESPNSRAAFKENAKRCILNHLQIETSHKKDMSTQTNPHLLGSNEKSEKLK